MIFYIVALLVIALDQLLKFLVHKYMLLGQSIPLFGDFLKLTYVRNTGAAFSLFTGYSFYLAIIGFVVVFGIVYFHYRRPAKNYYMQLALAFILGGSLGNITDRLFLKYVVDYIDVPFWPIFNLADIMINVGVFMIAAHLILAKGKKD